MVISHRYAVGVKSPNARGEDHHNSKLTEKEALEIRRLYDEGKIPSKEIARRFRVSVGCVRDIGHRRTWKRS